MWRDQPRWPKGTPTPRKGPGAGRWRDDNKPNAPRRSWAEVAAELLVPGRRRRREARETQADEQRARQDYADRIRDTRRRYGMPEEAGPEEEPDALGTRIRQVSTTQTRMRPGESPEEFSERLRQAVDASPYWNPEREPVASLTPSQASARQIRAMRRRGAAGELAESITGRFHAVGGGSLSTEQGDELLDVDFADLSDAELSEILGELQGVDLESGSRTPAIRAIRRMQQRRGGGGGDWADRIDRSIRPSSPADDDYEPWRQRVRQRLDEMGRGDEADANTSRAIYNMNPDADRFVDSTFTGIRTREEAGDVDTPNQGDWEERVRQELDERGYDPDEVEVMMGGFGQDFEDWSDSPSAFVDMLIEDHGSEFSVDEPSGYDPRETNASAMALSRFRELQVGGRGSPRQMNEQFLNVGTETLIEAYHRAVEGGERVVAGAILEVIGVRDPHIAGRLMWG